MEEMENLAGYVVLPVMHRWARQLVLVDRSKEAIGLYDGALIELTDGP